MESGIHSRAFCRFPGEAVSVFEMDGNRFTNDSGDELIIAPFTSQAFDDAQHIRDKTEYLQLLDEAIAYMKEGHASKIVLSRKKIIHASQKLSESSKEEIFKALCEKYPDAFVYRLISDQYGEWMGASPELLLSSGDQQLKTVALAGTVAIADETLLDAVQWGAKEKEEQDIVTRYIVAGLEKLGLRTSVQGPQTVRAGNLAHLKSIITADTKQHLLAKEVIETLHPTPAICGVPLEAARDFILQNEGYHRSLYTGYIGRISKQNEWSIYVNLRCMKIEGDAFHLYVGGGVTASSVALNEWQETENKSKTLGNVLEGLGLV